LRLAAVKSNEMYNADLVWKQLYTLNHKKRDILFLTRAYNFG